MNAFHFISVGTKKISISTYDVSGMIFFLLYFSNKSLFWPLLQFKTTYVEAHQTYHTTLRYLPRAAIRKVPLRFLAAGVSSKALQH